MFRFFCYCIFLGFLISSDIFANEIIVRFTSSVTLNTGQSFSKTPFSNHPDLNRILSDHIPDEIRSFFTPKQTGNRIPENIYIIRYPNKEKADDVLKELRQISGVEYCEPNHVYRIQSEVNDPFIDKQWYLKAIQSTEAWELETGNPEIIVGVIDTGVDYFHEDLQGQFWINSGEDLNGNGQFDAEDINGIDNDDNGYIDDVIGWDFTHAPRFPDQGDYLEPDNDPMDEFQSGHGTPVAGIIAARQNNGIGISGIAPGVRVMILRAGTASGYLEEDDVAEAIIYAVDNGCKIINMSFGDIAFSYLLRDAIRYGQSKGVIFVAAAGNNGNMTPNYPAAYDETISVSASNSGNNIAEFSSFGDKINISAPGQEMFTCAIGNRYGNMNGTSFAAPVVSATLALLWSRYPDYIPEQIVGALYAGATDAGETGWDLYYGHGIVSLPAILQALNYGLAKIADPAAYSGISVPEVAITGSAYGPHIQGYQISYGTGESPMIWQPVVAIEKTQIIQDTLARWQISGLKDSLYTLELRLRQKDLPDVVFRNPVYIDRSPAQLKNLNLIEMQSGVYRNYLIEVETDDPCRVILHYRGAGHNSFNRTKTSSYLSNIHYLKLSQEEIRDRVEFYLVLENSTGLKSTILDNGNYFEIDLLQTEPLENIFSFRQQLTAPGYLFSGLTDFNQNGRKEILFSELSEESRFGPLQAIEWQDGIWVKHSLTAFPAIPRDSGDIFGDGYSELLAGYGQSSFILRAESPGEFPRQIAWMDSQNFWGSRLANLDGDPKLEMLAIRDGEWGIFDISQPDYRPQLKQQLGNPTAGSNQYGIPHAVVTDLNGNGFPEIVFGDYDGDVVIYSRANPSANYELLLSESLSGEDATYLLQTGEVNGDGRIELITVTRMNTAEITESNVDAPYWIMDIWQIDSGSLKRICQKNFSGVNFQRGVYNGLNIYDADNDGIAEIFFAPFPAMYMLQYNNSFIIHSFLENINSNAVLKGNVDGDGQTDLLVNNNSGIQQFNFVDDSGGLLPPVRLTATPLDTHRIKLSWWPVTGANYYKIYRSNDSSEFVAIDSTEFTNFLDTAVVNDRSYFYTITAVQEGNPHKESRRCEIVSATANPPPELLSWQVATPDKLLLEFNESMSVSAFNVDHYILNENRRPLNALRASGHRQVLLSFSGAFDTGDNRLKIFRISDSEGTPLKEDTLFVTFQFGDDKPVFFLEKIEIESKNRLKLFFSLPVNPLVAARVENYHLEPDGIVLNAHVDSGNKHVVFLDLDSRHRMGSLGVPYYLTVSYMEDSEGTPLSREGNRLQISRHAGDLTNVIVYPNPFRNDGNKLMFGNLPRECDIFIFSSGGRLLRRLIENDGNGGCEWDLKTGDGSEVGSGVYIYLVKSGREEVRGKFIIIK